MSDPSRGFETWWPGRGLPENLKPAFFMVWKAALDSVEAVQLAAPADLVRRLLEDHQRVEPHHADQCPLCREATAAIDGTPAQGEPQAIAELVVRDGAGQINIAAFEIPPGTYQLYLGKPAQGERQPVTEVWMVTSRTISAVFTSEERAQQFANGLPPTVSGGLSVYRCPVHA